MVKFSDIAGKFEHKHDDLAKFIGVWFLPEDNIVLGAFPAPTRNEPNGKRNFTHYTACQLMNDSTGVYEVSEQQERDIYLGIATVRDPALVTDYGRGSGNVGQLRGVWADLDVKGSGFNSQEQILEWLDSLPLKPTVIVRNGESGGIHGYWRIQDDDLPRLNKEHLLKWWTYLQSHAPTNAHGERIAIDRLTDVARLARLPGMVYWPKVQGAKYGTVALAGGSYEQLPLDALESLTVDSYAEHKVKVEVSRSANRKLNRELDRSCSSPLQRLMLEQEVNKLDWAQILVPYGWTELRQSSDGTRHWARPGARQKSANTDFAHDDGQISDVMSLHSASEETGLADLKESGTVITKYRVLLRLRYNDDVPALLNAIKNKSITSLGGFMSDMDNYNGNHESETT